MFIPNIRATFSDEQRAHWLPRAEAWEVVGCYAGAPETMSPSSCALATCYLLLMSETYSKQSVNC